MILEHLKLYNFRCYPQLELYPDSRFNVILGLNGQGKTSILEAVGLLTTLRSFRAARNGEMLRLSEGEGSVLGRVHTEQLDLNLTVKIWPKRKQATYNGKACKYLSEYVSKISAVTFSPADLEIVRGGPDNRRVWVDRLCQLFDPTHADLVSRYQKILDQRNKQLKSFAEGRIRGLQDDFEAWTEELLVFGAKIIHNRIHNVDKAVDRICDYYDKIANEKSNITIGYCNQIFDKVPCGQANQYSLELITRALKESLERVRPKEVIVGSTLVGPHRDDLELNIEGNPAKTFGSQGEIRSLVLALRLTEVDVAKNAQGSSPILLIDDFSSELDANRRKFLLDYLLESDSQVFLSTTEELRIGKTFFVSGGTVTDQTGYKGQDDGYATH